MAPPRTQWAQCRGRGCRGHCPGPWGLPEGPPSQSSSSRACGLSPLPLSPSSLLWALPPPLPPFPSLPPIIPSTSHVPGVLLGPGDSAENETKHSPAAFATRMGCDGWQGPLLARVWAPGTARARLSWQRPGLHVALQVCGSTCSHPEGHACPQILGDPSELRRGRCLGVKSPRSQRAILEVRGEAPGLAFHRPPTGSCQMQGSPGTA